MKRLATSTAVLICCLAGNVSRSAQTSQIPEEQLVLQLRSVNQNCVGAARDTQQRIINALQKDLAFRDIEVKSAIVSGFSGIDLDPRFFQSSIRQGFSMESCGNYQIVPSDLDRVAASILGPGRGRDAGGGGRGSVQDRAVTTYYRALRATKSYQDVSIDYFVVIPWSTNLDNVRQGQKISFTFSLMSVSGSAVSGALTSLSSETAMLKCPNGHEYAPASGYKFCPIDGLPVKGGASY